MIVSISQPRYLPWLGYLERMALSDVFVYLDTVQFTPRDYENRTRVKTASGPAWLTVPVKARHRAAIPEVRVDSDQPWEARHWRTLVHAYGGSAHFVSTAGRFEALYTPGRWQCLRDLAVASTELLAEALAVCVPRTVRASELGVTGRGSMLLRDICRAVGGDLYLSGPHGKNYLDRGEFEAAGISVCWHEYGGPAYPQLHGEFVHGLSAIDALFNSGDAARALIGRGQSPTLEGDCCE